MVALDADHRTEPRLSPHLRGHLLQFEKRPTVKHDAAAGVRLLLAAVALEVVRLAAVTWLQPAIPLWLWLPLLLGLALLAVPALTASRPSEIGLHPWREWTRTEKSYFLQVVLLANLLFPLAFATSLRNRFVESGAASTLWGVFLPYLCFGFYQEVVYRGMVQREVVRRWSSPAGILIANVLYTFGPLHWNYFSLPRALAGPLFGAIFVMGLFFGLLFARSGNLWIVAVFHAIGNAYIVASLSPVRSATG
jgi:membrane protease YdiL (CAAX protease family)